jgi:hypothetical protein
LNSSKPVNFDRVDFIGIGRIQNDRQKPYVHHSRHPVSDRTVAYIAALGLYRLFISTTDVELPMRLKIDSLKDLEDKIIGVIVAALAVAFLGHAAGGDEPTALLRYGGGIAIMVAALAFFMRYTGKNSG